MVYKTKQVQHGSHQIYFSSPNYKIAKDNLYVEKGIHLNNRTESRGLKLFYV